MGVNVISPRQSPHVKPILLGSAPLCSPLAPCIQGSLVGARSARAYPTASNLRAISVSRRTLHGECQGAYRPISLGSRGLDQKRRAGAKARGSDCSARISGGEAAAAKKVSKWQHLQSSVFQVLTKSKIAFRPAVMTFVGERPAQSGRGLPHSKALSRSSEAPSGPPGLGVRQSSGALEPIRSWANYS